MPAISPFALSWSAGQHVSKFVNSTTRFKTSRRSRNVASPRSLSRPSTVLTISYSSTVAAAIRARNPRSVLCMASEPGGEGHRMAESLAATVIDDDEAIGQLPAETVLIGADAITPTSLVNKVRTAELARAASDKGIACFALAGETKFLPVELPVKEPFERCELAVFTAIVTPTGLLTPSEAASQAEAVELHEALRALIGRFEEESAEAPAE